MQKETRRLRTEDKKTEIREDIALLLVCEDRTEKQREETGAEKNVLLSVNRNARKVHVEFREKERRRKKKRTDEEYVSAVATSRSRVRVSIQIVINLIIKR